MATLKLVVSNRDKPEPPVAHITLSKVYNLMELGRASADANFIEEINDLFVDIIEELMREQRIPLGSDVWFCPQLELKGFEARRLYGKLQRLVWLKHDLAKYPTAQK